MREATPGYLFIAPAFLLLLLVLGYPAAASLWQSVQPAEGGPGPTLDHYAALARSGPFWRVVGTTASFVAASVTVHLLLGLAVALALDRPFRGRSLARVVVLLPWVVPDVVAGNVWKWVFNPLYGLLNELLLRAQLVDQPVDWLGHPALALPSVIVANVWRGFPFVMIILLAGLQGIREELHEAAAIDGAGPLARFRDVTLPGLRKPLVVALALDTVWEVRRFGLVQAMTGGGPGIATEVLSTQVFKQYFQFFRFEYASAMAIAMTALLLVLSLPYVRMIVREEE